MLARLSLFQKGILVLGLTLLIQFAFINSLALMQKNAVREIDRGLQIQTTVSHLTAVSNLWSNLATSAFRAIVHGGDSKSLVLSKYTDQFAREFAEIKRLL
ncbi:MAG TPA: hypothetical protein V6C72_11145, partial [Chroococcales cyanobacterium]